MDNEEFLNELRAYGQAHFIHHFIEGELHVGWTRRTIGAIRLSQDAARRRAHSGMLLLFIIEELGYPSLFWFQNEHEERWGLLQAIDHGAEEEVREILEEIALRELQDSGMIRHIRFMMLANRAFQAGNELTVGMGPGEEGEQFPEGATMRGVTITGVEWDEFGFLIAVDMEWESDGPLVIPDEILDQQTNGDTIEFGSGDAPEVQ